MLTCARNLSALAVAEISTRAEMVRVEIIVVFCAILGAANAHYWHYQHSYRHHHQVSCWRQHGCPRRGPPICERWCIVFVTVGGFCQQARYQCCGYREKPGYCPSVQPTCASPYPYLFTKYYECSHDYNCPAGYKCCQDSCFAHKVCKPCTIAPPHPPHTAGTSIWTIILTTPQRPKTTTTTEQPTTTTTTEPPTTTTTEDTTTTTTTELPTTITTTEPPTTTTTEQPTQITTTEQPTTITTTEQPTTRTTQATTTEEIVTETLPTVEAEETTTERVVTTTAVEVEEITTEEVVTATVLEETTTEEIEEPETTTEFIVNPQTTAPVTTTTEENEVNGSGDFEVPEPEAARINKDSFIDDEDFNNRYGDYAVY